MTLQQLLAEQRHLQAKLAKVNEQIEESPCAGCGLPLETSDPRGCEACEGRFCDRGTCVYGYFSGDDILRFCAECTPPEREDTPPMCLV